MSRQDHLKKDAKEWKRDEGADYGRGKKTASAKDEGYRGHKSAPHGGAYSARDEKDGRFERKFESRGSRKPADRPARPEGRPAPRPQRETSRPQPPKPPRPVFEDERNPEPENLLSGRNPIREAIRSGRDIEKLLVAKGDLSATAREIVMMAKEAHIPVQVVERSRLDEITRNHQGMLAFASAYRYYDVEDMLRDAEERGEKPFLIILDGVTDPQNLGAIIRTAACVGAHGVIVPQRRAVGLTPSAVKASAGAIEKIKVARVTNLARTIDQLKAQGIWLFAADMKGEDFRKVDFSGAVALVIGSEGDGISRLTLEKCDHTVSLPMTGAVDSLNASVAAGILMYAVQGTR
ncbi:MAG: 23S rRNA (guanosine(2251)-2'-O)-methyltransferase RlmB [Clostridia bacterium]|nr:23S rRNA (guanosine(2251)-2'-O)-methyltransferase RlmB [Clostridia bacterium]